MMSDYGKATGRDSVRIERLLPGPIERVWSYLTESEKRGRWLATGEMELRVGGKVSLHFLHANLTDHQEAIPERYKSMECGAGFTGTITQYDPPRLLAYTWGVIPRKSCSSLRSKDRRYCWLSPIPGCVIRMRWRVWPRAGTPIWGSWKINC